jgi:hypothetical protein
MTSKPASVRSLKRLLTQVPTSDELVTVLLDLNREKNGRAWAITLAALLDAALESAIHTKLIPNISKKTGTRSSKAAGYSRPSREKSKWRSCSV